jgi:hypothetical protein
VAPTSSNASSQEIGRYLSLAGSYTIGSVSRPWSSSAKSVQPDSSVTVCAAKNSLPTFLRVISQVTCLMPFSQTSRCRLLRSSGQAQPGQSNPPFSWFIFRIACGPRTGSRVRPSTFMTLIAAPQPAAGASSSSWENSPPRFGPRPWASRPGAPRPRSSPGINPDVLVNAIPPYRGVQIPSAALGNWSAGHPGGRLQ